MKDAEKDYRGKDQNWQDEQTIYWFTLNGTEYKTNYTFDHETFGVVESGANKVAFVDSKNAPLTDGDSLSIAVKNLLKDAVTEIMRSE